jgi:hypothetical protein
MKIGMCDDCKIMIAEGWYVLGDSDGIICEDEDVIRSYCGKCGTILEVKDD